MDGGQTMTERRQFAPILDWVRGAGAGTEQHTEVRPIRRVSF
jgi:hypothetical protein